VSDSFSDGEQEISRVPTAMVVNAKFFIASLITYAFVDMHYNMVPRYRAEPANQVSDSVAICDYDELKPVAKRRFLDLIDAERPICVSPEVADVFTTYEIIKFTHYFCVKQVN
jgi:hypothetical protein